jgi:hypothetical protein
LDNFVESLQTQHQFRWAQQPQQQQTLKELQAALFRQNTPCTY